MERYFTKPSHVLRQSRNETLHDFKRQVCTVCSKSNCDTEKPLPVDQFFTGSKLHYRTIILFVFAWCKEKTTVNICEDE